LHASNLASGELAHATVVAVVHVVVYNGDQIPVTREPFRRRDSRMGSTPDEEQVSRPVGHPLAGEASVGVSDTRSPLPEQPLGRCDGDRPSVRLRG